MITRPDSLDPEELRAWAAGLVHRYLTFDAAGLRFLADVLDLADSTARADIECNLPYEGEGATIWYDTTLVAIDDLLCPSNPRPRSSYMIDQAIAYLEARGQLTRKPGAPEWIRPWGEDGR